MLRVCRSCATSLTGPQPWTKLANVGSKLDQFHPDLANVRPWLVEFGQVGPLNLPNSRRAFLELFVIHVEILGVASKRRGNRADPPIAGWCQMESYASGVTRNGPTTCGSVSTMIEATLTKAWPYLGQIRFDFETFDLIAAFAQLWPVRGKLCRTRAKLLSNSSQFWGPRAKLARTRPNSGRIWAKFGRPQAKINGILADRRLDTAEVLRDSS